MMKLKTIAGIAVLLLFLAGGLPALTAAGDAPGKININIATVEELSSLAGVGTGYAERIVEFRKKNGGFHAIEDLLLVPGIGSKIFEKNKDRLTVD
ncbi:MAG TPA: helix-hairpin-helix domain-containing protein [Syntrophales bacterium]|nr:helix-hairpin-helix domain-containing protein [Syntrophales bacterium]HQB30758.1 helix-hairpin-helix domain-containing protein [Syntrophales bacterium]HQN76701.1 helix-hairpin-helix domain-containing protein [Syntrophales bacterium]HQQ26054.1 helix-hairpin-helix domain-containing protein [Syntrophales bacterium]